MAEAIIPIVIYFIIPILGFGFYIFLSKKFRLDNPELVNTHELLFLFFTYGGLLLVLLTGIFWLWSGLASIGTFFISFIAPIAMFFIISSIKKKNHVSSYNKMILKFAKLYFLLLPLSIIIILIFS